MIWGKGGGGGGGAPELLRICELFTILATPEV